MNYHTKSIKQTKKFESDIQFYNMDLNNLKRTFKYIPEDVLKIIYDFIPTIFKKNYVSTININSSYRAFSNDLMVFFIFHCSNCCSSMLIL